MCPMKRWLVIGAVLLPVIAEAEYSWVLWWRESWFTNQDMQRTSWKRFSAAPTREGCDAMLKGAMQGVIEAGGGDKAHGENVVQQSEGVIVGDIATGPDGARYIVRMHCWPDTVDPRDTKGGE